MYKIHAVKCQQYAQRSANNMADVALMVSLSIQQNWLTVGDQLADVRKNKTDSKFETNLLSNASKIDNFKSNGRKIIPCK